MFTFGCAISLVKFRYYNCETKIKVKIELKLKFKIKIKMLNKIKI
jgi:hypothetical protein